MLFEPVTVTVDDVAHDGCLVRINAFAVALDDAICKSAGAGLWVPGGLVCAGIVSSAEAAGRGETQSVPRLGNQTLGRRRGKRNKRWERSNQDTTQRQDRPHSLRCSAQQRLRARLETRAERQADRQKGKKGRGRSEGVNTTHHEYLR